MSTDAMRRTAPSIKVDGAALPARAFEDLLSVRVARGVRTTGRATLTFVDRTFELARSSLKIGAQVEISSIEPAVQLFQGTVAAVATDVDRDGARATITAYDKSYEMARQRAAETFTQQKAVDVLRTLARSSGLRLEAPPGGGGEVQEWTWRVGSVLGEIDALCERLGWDWTVEGDTLRCTEIRELRVPESSCTLELGTSLLRFGAEQTRPVATEVAVRGWDPANKQVVAASATTPAETHGFQANGARSARRATSLVTRHNASSAAEARLVAESIAAGAATVHARGRAELSPLVQPGKAVTIKGAGPSDGSYYVREVEHVFGEGPTRTTFVAGFRTPTLLSDPWLSGRGSTQVAAGVHVGVVRNVNDPRGLGRVRVQLPSVSEDDELGWARVMAVGGGPERGIQWLPEIGDEVLVAFEDGDARRPVVVGGLFSSVDKPPLDGPGSDRVDRRTLTSRRGHRIELGDGDTEEEQYVDIVLAGDDVRLHIGLDRIDLETRGKPLRLASGQDEIVLDGKGTVTIKAQNVKIQAAQDVTVEGMNVKAKGSTTVGVEAAQATVKASSALKLQSSGIAELSGSVVKIN